MHFCITPSLQITACPIIPDRSVLESHHTRMRLRIVWTIFRKEITETLRDRRTLLMMVGLPVLLYPLMMIGLTKLQRSHVEAQEARASKIALWGDVETELSDWLSQTNVLSVESWGAAPDSVREAFEAGKVSPPSSEAHAERRGKLRNDRQDEEIGPVAAAAREAIASREIDAVLVVWPGFSESLAEGGLGTVSIYFDSVRDDSKKAHERLHDQLAEFRKLHVERRERELGVPEGFSKVVQTISTNVAPPVRQVGLMLGSLLPFVLILMSASGGLYAAIDLTAGEKERNTMQTLLCAPLHPTEIIGGKFLAAWAVVVITTMANLTSLAATFARVVIPMGDFAVPPSTYLITFAMLLPVTFTITAVFLAVAVFAKDFKDGQNFLTPVMMALMLPLGATMLPGTELNAWTAFVPIVNVALLIKALFIAEAKPDLMFLTLISSVIYAVLTLLLAARVFHREQVLLGGRESVRSFFQFERPKLGTPTPAFSFIAFAIMFVLLFYGTLLLTGADVITMILGTQLGFFLAPALVLAALMRFSPRETFFLRLPDWRGIVAAVVIGLSAWTVAAGILVRLLPPPDSVIEALEKMMLLGDARTPLWTLLLVLAVTPAVCEELFFRGLVMSGLRRYGKWPAILISAFLFALAHSSIYRLLPTLFLGVLLGLIVWQTRSILCAMIVHAINNGIAVTLLHFRPVEQMKELSEPYLPWNWTLIGVSVLVIGLWMLRSFPGRGNAGEAEARASVGTGS
jgi:sodium transport system permease protein